MIDRQMTARPWNQAPRDDSGSPPLVNVVILTALLWPAGLVLTAVYASRARKAGLPEANYWVSFGVTLVLLAVALSMFGVI